ncbi:carboxypeptidase-like regulatory domain-containing protein [Streptomyces sp. NPDC003943]
MRSDLRRRSELRRISAVSLVTALALGAAATPALAEDPAPAPTVGIGRAVTNDAQRGSFRVTAWTDAPQATVTEVSAKVRQGDTVLADIPKLVPNPQSPGSFVVPDEATLKLTEDGGTIPDLGTYTIDVTATDSLGHAVTRPNAGTLDFTLRPVLWPFTIKSATWEDPNWRPQGKVYGIQPGSGDEVPLSGRTVSYQQGGPDGEPAGSAVSDAEGNFAGEPIPATGSYAWLYATYSENSATVHGSTNQWTSGQASAKPMTLTAAADRARAASGQTVTISGRLTDPAANGAPIPNEPIKARLGGGLPRTVNTDADGRFSVRLVAAPTRNGEGWSIEPATPFQGFGYPHGPLALPQDSRTTVLGYRLGADARLSVYGELRSPYEWWNGTSSQQTTDLEWSPDGRTGWRRIGSTNYYSSPRVAFGVAVWTRGGWFRLHHLESDYYADSVSKPFYVTRTATRIIGVNANPEPVRKGAAMTVTGTLQQAVGGVWKGYGNAPVTLWFQARGSTAWKQLATGRTAANGAVTFRTTATVDGSYTIRHSGDGTHFNAPAAYNDYVDVR